VTASPSEQICVTPWYELNVMYNRRVGCCCYYNGYVTAWDNKRPRDLFDYWNGDLIQRIRQEVADGRPDTGCAECGFYRFKPGGAIYAPSFFDMPADVTESQRENWQKAQASYQERRIVVDHTPLRFYFNFGVACNIACIMCGQTAERHDKTTLDPDILWHWRAHFEKAERLSLIGGEPLALAESLRFIRKVIADPGLSAVELDLYSNGVTLDRHLDMLSAKEKVSICVSLDGVGPAYEKIRAGSEWSRVERNLLAFKELAARKGLPWRLTTANLIMKSSLACLDELVSWHIAHDIVPNFADFSLAPGIETTFLAENVFEFPHLLEEIPGWSNQLDTSARKLEKQGWWGPAAILRDMKLQLLAKLFAPR
jgi:hypothetical protein